jgi:hypothetical protein
MDTWIHGDMIDVAAESETQLSQKPTSCMLHVYVWDAMQVVAVASHNDNNPAARPTTIRDGDLLFATEAA